MGTKAKRILYFLIVRLRIAKQGGKGGGTEGKATPIKKECYSGVGYEKKKAKGVRRGGRKNLAVGGKGDAEQQQFFLKGGLRFVKIGYTLHAPVTVFL